jgi:hypothetical protein
MRRVAVSVLGGSDFVTGGDSLRRSAAEGRVLEIAHRPMQDAHRASVASMIEVSRDHAA